MAGSIRLFKIAGIDIENNFSWIIVLVLPLMVSRDVNQLPVMQDGRLVGVLSRDAIMRYLEIKRSLGLEDWRKAA